MPLSGGGSIGVLEGSTGKKPFRRATRAEVMERPTLFYRGSFAGHNLELHPTAKAPTYSVGSAIRGDESGHVCTGVKYGSHLY